MQKSVIGCAGLFFAVCGSLEAADIVKQNNTEALETGASWVGGVAPGAADVAVWSNNLAGANASALSSAATWDGVKVLNPGGPVTVSGSARLTLDGGAAADINLAAAGQNLTFEGPVSMGGAVSNEVAAGRVLTFSGPLEITSSGNWGRSGWGTVVFDGPVTSAVATTLELQRGTNIFTGKNGGLSFTSTSSGARIYVGRNSGSVSTLIISNGVHEVRGIHPEANANFVGVSASGTLIMEGGSLTLAYLRAGINGGNGTLTVNNGKLEATAGNNTNDLNGYGMMLGNQHTDGTDKQAGSGSVTVNGGAAIFTNGVFKLGSKNTTSTGTLAVGLNGGLLAVRRFYVDGCPQVSKTFTLNGGTLLAPVSGTLFDGPGVTNGSMTVRVGDGGAVIDTGASHVTNAAALTAAGEGGLTKLGAGSLTLLGTNTYTGRTRVQAGTLRFAGAAAALTPDLAVMSRAGLSLADGALTTFSPSALVMGTAVSAATLELELAQTGASCDVLALPAGAVLGRLAFLPVIQGTSARAMRVGDYAVMTYAGSAPDTSLFTVAEPAPQRSYSFIINEQAKTVTLRIGYAAGESEWIASGSGSWETPGNWTLPPQNAAGAKVRLGDAITAPATVTASAPVTLGGLTVDAPNAYTVAGGGFTFDNGALAPSLAVKRGAHGVSAPLTLAGDLSVNLASGTLLAFGGALGGSGALVKEGEGEAWLTQPNSYAGGTQLKQGPLLLGGTATLGSGPVTVNGGSGFRVVGAAPLTLDNDLALATAFAVNALSNSLALTGTIDWQGSSVSLSKSGGHELSLSGTGTETALARFAVENGRLAFKAGADFSLLSTAERDAINMKANNSNIREVVLESGSQVTVAGIDMEYGASNTVRVSGGRLRVLGGGGSADAVSMRGQGAGLDRFIVDAGEVTVDEGKWFGVGFRVGDARLIVNGGTTTLSRVSLGARDMDMDLSARGFVDIAGGLLEVTGSFGWMGSSTVGRTNIVTLGNGTPGSGVWRTCATSNPRYDRANTPILRFNGGTLETRGLAAYGASSLDDFLFGAKRVTVDEGGARIDTRGLVVAITQPLQKGAETDGGLTKLGAGRLTLAGACDFTGSTVVEAGQLTLPASYASASLTVASGATVSFANGGIQTFSPSAVTLQSGATVVFEALADGSACDQLVLPAGATVGNIAVALLRSGTPVAASAPGDYPVFAFSGGAPDVSGWTLQNPPQGRTASLEVVGSTVVVRIAYAAGVSIWTQSGSGDWETGGNWTAAPADAAGTAVRFDGAITAAATVTRASGSTAGSVTFNSVYPYTLAGAALTLQGVESVPPSITAEYGNHAVQAAVVLAEDAAVRLSSGATVALNGGASGSATLTVEGPGTLSLPDASVLAVDGVALTAAGRLAFTNSTVLTVPVALGAGGGVLAPAAGSTLDVGAAVTGAGSLFKEASSLAILTNAVAAYSGVTGVRAGTLRLDRLSDGGIAFGQGTLHYVGGATTVAGGYTLDTGDDTRAGVLRADGDITFQGLVSALSGALVKTGPGTVSFTAPGRNVFNAGNGAGASHNVLDIGARGDSPTTGFSGFNVVDGKVVIGAAGQTNVFNGLLVVGLNSTTNADAETAGQLDVVGGTTEITDALIVGRSNGTTNTAPTARASRLRMTGGELSVQTLVLGRTLLAAEHNSAPEAELAGGLLTAANPVIVGEQAGVSATLKLSGGTLVAPNIVRINGVAHLRFDGGTFRPAATGQTLQGLTSAKVGAGGATIDLSLAEVYTLTQVLTTDGADGGLTKSGAGALVVNGQQAYAGPTLVSAGTLRIPVAGSLSNVTALTVSPGAALELDAANTQTVSVASLTLGAAAAAPAALKLAFRADGAANDRLAVSGALSLGEVDVTLVRVGLGDEFGVNGTYTVMTYAGSDPEVAGLSVVNPLYGKRYVFAAASGTVTVTIETDYTGANGGAVWNAAGGGSWFDAGNWVTAPGAGGAGQQVRFDDKIAAPATVTVGGAVTVGEIYFNNTSAYTVAGAVPLSLDNGGQPAVLSAELGSHTVAAPVAVPDAGLSVQAVAGTGVALDGALSGSGPIVKTAGGSLAFGAANTRTGTTTVQGGDLILKNGGNTGSGELVLDGAGYVYSRGSAPAVLNNPVTLKSGSPILQLDEQPLTLAGALDWQAGAANLYKWGTNDLVLAGTGNAGGTPRLFQRQGGLVFASGANYTLAGNTRESIKLGLNDNIKSSMTIEPGAKLKLGGILASATATATVGNDVAITQNGGTVELTNTSGDNGDALFLRDYGTAPAAYVMNGGSFTMPAASWANLGNFGPALLTVNGGSMTLGRVAAGLRTNAVATANGWVEVTVNGGRLEAAGSWSWMSDGSSRRTLVTVNGGTLALPVTRTYGASAARWTSLTLNGGLLELTGAALDAADPSDWLAGVRRVALGSAGGAIDTRTNDAGIRQSVMALDAAGGLAKTGPGALTLSGTNTLWGLADVQEGTLRARFTHRDLPASPLLWLGMDGTDNPDLSGNGFAVSLLGSGVTATNRLGKPALAFDGAGAFSVAYNTVYTNVAAFTASAWIYVTFTATDSNQSIISARPGGDRAFEFKLNGNDNKLRLLQHTYNTSTDWWQDIRSANPVPLNQWVHVAAAMDASGVAMYINGVRQTLTQHVGAGGGTQQPYAGGWPYAGNIRLLPSGRTGVLMVGRSSSTASAALKGSLDDVMLFERVLSDAEVAQLASESPVEPLDVRVGALGTLDLQGETARVSAASGNGLVLNGTLAVKSLLAPGDDAGSLPGAVLDVQNLALGTNVVYTCTLGASLNDRVDVGGLLTVEGAGVIDLGRTPSDPVTGSFSMVVMTYGSIAGAANFADWTVTGLGRNGFDATVTAADGEVVVNLKSTWGTVLFLK